MQAAETVPTTLKAERWRKLPGLVIFRQLEIFEPTEAMYADNTLVHLLTITNYHNWRLLGSSFILFPKVSSI